MSGETSKTMPSAASELGPIPGGPWTTIKAKCLPLRTKDTEAGWGVVQFYSEEKEMSSLDEVVEDDLLGKDGAEHADGSTLCIPAVPGHMSPGDFLGFVGDRWIKDLSHCRMVVTGKNNYLVLLKFRDSELARSWQKEFEGQVFNTMEPTRCHVVFVKKILSKTPTQLDVPAAFSAVSNFLTSFPPPVPSLSDLPTCAVCFETMDETNGLMTIACSHVFHCACLQSWKRGGCPVCRFPNAFQGDSFDPANPYTQPFGGSSVSNLCTVCDCTDDLWMCLICGHVGCGRYKGGHAKDHWKDTAHNVSLELDTLYAWDYAGDTWVHRLIRDKGDGKFDEQHGRNDQRQEYEDEDVVPRAKLESIGLEYTHLITSQLALQRAYYEKLLSKASDKASNAEAAKKNANAAQEDANKRAAKAMEECAFLNKTYTALSKETIPQLERDIEREKAKSSKSQDLARNLSKAVQEEKQLNEGLMKRIKHLNADHDAAKTGLEKLKEETKKQKEEIRKQKEEIAELKDLNHDLNAFISGQAQLQEMEKVGEIGEGDIECATMSVPGKKGRRKK